MKDQMIDALRREEAAILAELQASPPVRRLGALRGILRLYEETAPVGASLDALLDQQGRPRVRQGA